jgi:hypothetical protein
MLLPDALSKYHELMQGLRDAVGAACRALPVWLGVGSLHLGLGLALKLYFFQYWSS